MGRERRLLYSRSKEMGAITNLSKVPATEEPVANPTTERSVANPTRRTRVIITLMVLEAAITAVPVADPIILDVDRTAIAVAIKVAGETAVPEERTEKSVIYYYLDVPRKCMRQANQCMLTVSMC